MATTYNAANDLHSRDGISTDAIGRNAAAVTPSDTVDITPYPKAVCVTVTGDLKVLPLFATDGTFVTFSSAPVGFVVPFRVRRVQATGTTASACTIDDT